LPFITETIYQGLFASGENSKKQQFDSIHLSSWPLPNPMMEDDLAEQVGTWLVEIAVSVRRYKSERGLPLGSELHRLQIAHQDEQVASQLESAVDDLASITRAREILIRSDVDPGLNIILETKEIRCGI
jgi:valyl-tRNA synthetase